MSDETIKEYQQVQDRRDELQEVFDRMDEDEKLYFLEDYEMTKLPPRQTEKLQDVANITLNDPLIFGNKGIAVLGSATKQTVIEGEGLTDKQTSRIESFLDDVFYVIDESLPKRKIPNLDGFVNEQVCLRGRWGSRICVRIDKKTGKVVFDLLPIDGKCYADETDGENKIFGAHWWEASKSQLEREFSQPGDSLPTLEASGNEVVDYWSPEKNMIFINKKVVREQENTYGYVPMVDVVCEIGSFLNSTRALAHQGESIFWPNRGLWAEKNRVASILLTMTVKALFGGLQFPNPAGTQAEKPAISPYENQVVHPIPKDSEYKPMPLSDLKAATRLLYSILETSLQRGSIAAIDYGTLTFPLSSLAITRLTASRDDMFLPRVNAIAEYYQAVSNMIIDQCIALDQAIEITGAGSDNKYTKADLDRQYTIMYTFRTISQEQEIANLSIANASRGLLPDDMIRRDILKLDNPDGAKFELDSEQAERTDEVLFLFRKGMALLEEKDGEKPTTAHKIEASILLQRIRTILKQRQQMGQLSPIEGKPETGQKQPEPEEILPLLDQGRGGRARGGGEPLPPEPAEAKESVNGQAEVRA